MKEKEEIEIKNNSEEKNEIDQKQVINFGEFMRMERDKLKISIEEIALRLKIKPSNIIAIENNQFDKIGKYFYIFGIIKSYAKILKIDQKIVEEFIKSLPIESNTNNKKHKLINVGENIELSPDKDTTINFFIISIILFLALLSLYHFQEQKGSLITNKHLVEKMTKLDQ
jgi:cytoskeletal protein RodZ